MWSQNPWPTLLVVLLRMLAAARLTAGTVHTQLEGRVQQWIRYGDTVCGCAEGNTRNWPPSNPNPIGELGAYWVAAPRDNVSVCELLCERDSACTGFQWTAVSNQIPERDVCWFRKDAACHPSPPSGICELRQCAAAVERDCYVKPPAVEQSAPSEASPPSRPAAAPANISYDERALLVDGKRRLFAAGSIHYARSTPEMWPGLMAAAKSMGIDVITTYIFWNLHEVGHNTATGDTTYDFETGRLNLRGFLQVAKEAGLLVFLRLGPFACAEWTYGGIPTRLRRVKSNYSGPGSSAPRMTFRSWDPSWRREMSAFIARTVHEVRPFLAGNGGPVMMLQPENEYGNIEQYYGDDGKKYAQWCADLVGGMRPGVPIAMCQQQGVEGVIETCNGFYCDPHDKSIRYPSIFTEAWSGWFQSRDGSPGHRPASDLAYAVAKFVAEGGTMWNLYMLQGGTNFGHTAGAGIATSYDAPITEWGFARQPKYGLLQKLHAVLRQFEKAIVENEPLQWWSQGVQTMPGLSVHPYGVDVMFLVNTNTTQNYTYRANCATPASISVPPWSVSIVDGRRCATVFNTADASWLQQTPESTTDATIREIRDFHREKYGTRFSDRTDIPVSWEFFPEPTNLSWCTKKQRTAHRIPELIDATGGPLATDYLYAAVELPAGSAHAVLTAMESPLEGGPLGGVHHVDGFLDGVWFEMAPGYPSKLPGNAAASGSVLTLRIAISGLPNYLWSNALCQKNACDGPWDSHLEKYDRGLLGPILLNQSTGNLLANMTHATWSICVGLAGESMGLFDVNASQVNWQKGSQPLVDVGTWVRLQLALPATVCSDQSSGVALNLTGMRVGEAWINGQSIGRCSLSKIGYEKDCVICNATGPYDPNSECHTRCGKYAEPLYHVPRGWLVDRGLCESLEVTTEHVILWETESGADPSKIAFVSVVGSN